MGKANAKDDLFLSSPKQLGFDLSDTAATAGASIDPDEVRAELQALLDTARGSSGGAPPWDARTHRYHQLVFPQMARWLPADEADELCRQFALELGRWEQSQAA